MIIREEFLWVQKYRPKSVQELILPEDIRDTLTSFVEQGSLPNFLFHSQSGGCLLYTSPSPRDRH